MTEQTLRKLTRKRTLTGKQRAALLREANRRIALASNILASVMDSCGDDADKIDQDDDATRAQEAHADDLTSAHDDLEELVEKLDDLPLLSPGDVL